MRLRRNLARNVRQLRDLKGLSQEELSALAHIDRTYVSHIENCNYAATIDVLEELAAALQVDPADLLRGE
jgi:transcriptional regulator with XRE-family HTH domain